MSPDLPPPLPPESVVLRYWWVLALAVVVGTVVRALKPDTPIPVDVPARWRAPLAVVLGIASGLVVWAFQAVPLTLAQGLAGGFAAGMLAITGHDVIIESLFHGKEIPMGPKPPPAPPPAPERSVP